MKKTFIILSFLFVSFNGWAQIPQSFKYQAVARNEADELLKNSNISIRISIIDSAAGGALVYSEVHKTSTNKFGLFSIPVGAGITPTGVFANIPWQTGNKWMKTEIDPSAGSSFIDMGVAELISVPYALLAGSAMNESQTLSLSGNTLSISGGNSVTLSTGTVDTDDQTLSLTGTTLSIQDGNSVNLSVLQDGVNDADSDSLNEIQTLTFSGNMLSISGGNSITLPTGTIDTDDQTLSLSGTTLSIQDGNSVDLSVLQDGVNDADSNPLNEIQTLSLSGNMLSISGGNSIALPAGTIDSDADSTNELNISFNLDTISKTLSIMDAGSTLAVDLSPLFSNGLASDSNWTIAGNNMYNNNSGNVGIGISAPTAKLHVAGNDGVLSTGTFGTGNIPVTGAGTRMMWYPAKAAFRVGKVLGTDWDATNIGDYSFASGDDTYAVGVKSTAMGSNTSATGNLSTALGLNTVASGNVATAMGATTSAFGDRATSMGFFTNAVGDNSTAMGNFSIAHHTNSLAGGYQTNARGTESVAFGRQTYTDGIAAFGMGDSVIATGNYTVALGRYASTNNNAGTFVFGDNSTTTFMNADSANRFMVRATGGFIFYTSSTGPQSSWAHTALYPGQNSWSTVSDKNKKENFKPVNEEEILQKISGFQLGTWNYKGQDATQFRHYGPMAQDFYATFGNDGIGTIGTETSIASADLMGVNFTAIHALEKRTSEQITVQKKQQELIEQLLKENIQLKERLENVEGGIKKLNKKIKRVTVIPSPTPRF